MRYLALLILLLVFSFSLPVSAQQNLPPLNEEAMADEAPIRLSPDGPAIIKLNEDATSVIIGNPAHATALLENPRLMMLMPALPGATKVIALNRDGKAIFNKHVLVGTGKSGFKRVNRVCATAADRATCQPVSMYYCPDKCYETAVSETTGVTGATGDIANPVVDAPEDNSAEDSAAQGINETTDVIQ